MRKRISMLLVTVTVLVLALAGCGNDSSNAGNAVTDELAQGENGIKVDGGEAEQDGVYAEILNADTTEQTEDIDVDLTRLSSTMVYSEVYNMMYTPNDYIGKVVKMDGAFVIYEGEGQNYYACQIADAAACCAQGIEFVWAGDHSYPEDYPELGSNITVTGIFETYYEGEYLYCHLVDAEVTF